MTSLVIAGDVSGAIVISSPLIAGSGTLTLPVQSAANILASAAVTASVSAVVTTKIKVNISGTDYYLLASTVAT